MFRKRTGGFSLISAIFLLLVVAVLGAYVATVASNQHIAGALDVEGARAYQAARAGVEWGAWQVLRSPGGGFSTSCDAAPYSQALAGLAGTLSGFAVQVDCVSTATTEAGVNIRVYRLTVTASKGSVGSMSYVERQLQAVIERDG